MIASSVTPGLAGDSVYIFSRPGCPPCESMHRALKADPSLLAGVDVFKVNTQDRPDIARRFSVTSVPVAVLVRDGKEVRRRVGWTNAADFAAWLDDVQYRRQFK